MDLIVQAIFIAFIIFMNKIHSLPQKRTLGLSEVKDKNQSLLIASTGMMSTSTSISQYLK